VEAGMSSGDRWSGFGQTDVPNLMWQDFPTWSSTVTVEFAAESRCGRPHAINEDHYAVIQLGRYQETLFTSLPDGAIAKRFDEYGHAMVVADGMGDGGSGERASRLAIATLMHLVMYYGKWNLRIDRQISEEIRQRAEEFYREVDSIVTDRGSTASTPDLQTSLTATFGAGRDLFFAHVGHSRAYLFRQGELMLLTRDHTLAAHRSRGTAPLVNVNLAAPDLKHILTQTIGMRGSIGPQIDLETFQIDDGDLILVCTNGLTDMVDEEAVANVLSSHEPPAEQCRTLVELAMAAGGEDDVTALLARYRVPALGRTLTASDPAAAI
jgi:protein phosphatase